MKRVTLINIHLVLASVFLPFMLLMPLTGALYLLDIKGEQSKTEAFRIDQPVPAENREEFFREQFRKQNLDFDFEYIRANGKDFTFRPSSRVHYSATQDDTGVVVFKLEPDIIKRLIEIHKGHGPTAIRWLEVAFALTLILVTLSGVWLAWVIPSYRRMMGVSFLIGAAIILAGLL